MSWSEWKPLGNNHMVRFKNNNVDDYIICEVSDETQKIRKMSDMGLFPQYEYCNVCGKRDMQDNMLLVTLTISFEKGVYSDHWFYVHNGRCLNKLSKRLKFEEVCTSKYGQADVSDWCEKYEYNDLNREGVIGEHVRSK